MPRRFSWVGFVGFLLLCPWLQGMGCGPVQQCLADADCAAGEICQKGVCIQKTTPPVCLKTMCGADCADLQTSNAHCGACGQVCGIGANCKQGQCVAVVPPCTSNADCKAGEICKSGVCQTSPPPCTPTSGCKANEVCANGVCRPVTPGCLSDADCKPDEFCNQASCVLKCPFPRVFCSATCTDLESDNQHCGACGNRCGVGSQCKQGKCSALTTPCASNTDCLPGEICKNGFCSSSQPACTADADCLGGEICHQGLCRPCLSKEICGDGIDNNCDGQIDENCPPDICKTYVPKYKITGRELPTGLVRAVYTIEILSQLPPSHFASTPKASLSTNDWQIEQVTFDPKNPYQVLVQVGFSQNLNGSATLTLEGSLTIEGSGVPVIATCPFQASFPISACLSQEVCGDGIDNNCDGQIDEGCTCPAGQTFCANQCVDLQNDISHCGACGNRCGLGSVCNQGQCKPLVTPCSSNTDCLPGEVCQGGFCATSQPRCSSNADCSAGQICQGGVCAPSPPRCSSNADCSAGQICVNGVCF